MRNFRIWTSEVKNAEKEVFVSSDDQINFRPWQYCTVTFWIIAVQHKAQNAVNLLIKTDISLTVYPQYQGKSVSVSSLALAALWWVNSHIMYLKRPRLIYEAAETRRYMMVDYWAVIYDAIKTARAK